MGVSRGYISFAIPQLCYQTTPLFSEKFGFGLPITIQSTKLDCYPDQAIQSSKTLVSCRLWFLFVFYYYYTPHTTPAYLPNLEIKPFLAQSKYPIRKRKGENKRVHIFSMFNVVRNNGMAAGKHIFCLSTV